MRAVDGTRGDSSSAQKIKHNENDCFRGKDPSDLPACIKWRAQDRSVSHPIKLEKSDSSLTSKVDDNFKLFEQPAGAHNIELQGY